MNITELPIRKWTQDYKEYLEGLIKPEDKNQKAVLTDYKEHHTGANVHFELQTVENAVTTADEAQMLANFKLTTKISLGKLLHLQSAIVFVVILSLQHAAASIHVPDVLPLLLSGDWMPCLWKDLLSRI